MALLPDPATLSAASLLVLVCGVVFAESGLLVGFWLPGDTVLFPAGLATASPRVGLSPLVLAGCAGLAAVVGYELSYAVGRRWGRPLVLGRAGRRMGPQALARAEALTGRFGAAALVAARFVPWVRTLAPLLAGAARMPRPRFTAANVVGALVWAVGLVLLGRAAAHLPVLRHAALGIAVGCVAGSVAVAAVGALRRRRR